MLIYFIILGAFVLFFCTCRYEAKTHIMPKPEKIIDASE